MAREDMYKTAVSVLMIHLILLFVFEAFMFTSPNPSDAIVMTSLNNIMGESNNVSNQIESVGLCLEGTATQTECELRGCVWDNGQCFNSVENRQGINFGFFDVILSILKIPIYLGKFIIFLGSVVFFELILSFKLMPLIHLAPLRYLVTLILWGYNALLVYYMWAFISNWRGQR